jgi:outer membrane protein TolC
MDRIGRSIVVAFLALAPHAVAAREGLTLERAVQTALSHNAALRAARAAAGEAGAREAAARSEYFPRIALTESWRRSDQPVFAFSSLLSARRFAAGNFEIETLNHPDPIALHRAELGVEQVIFDGGRRRSAAETAALGHEISKDLAIEAEAAVAVATTEAFGRVLSGEAARRAAESGAAAAREDLARAERRRDEGMATDADVLALVVHLADLEQRGIQARAGAEAAAAELNRLMGEPVDAQLHVIEPSGAPVAATLQDTASLLSEADAARPEIRRSSASERIAGAARRQARAALLPQVVAQAGLEIAGTDWNDRASSWMVGAELRWSFSTGGAEAAALRVAAASMERTCAEADDVRAGVHVEVVSALRRAQAARARFEVGATAVEQARESQRIVRDRFEAGVAPVNDVLRASAALLDAEANRAAALVDSVVAMAVLNRALGRIP